MNIWGYHVSSDLNNLPNSQFNLTCIISRSGWTTHRYGDKMFIPNTIWARVCFARTAWRSDGIKDTDQSPISYYLTCFSILALDVISFNFSSYPLLIKCIFGSFHCRHAQLCAFSPVILLLHSSKFCLRSLPFQYKSPTDIPLYEASISATFQATPFHTWHRSGPCRTAEQSQTRLLTSCSAKG